MYSNFGYLAKYWNLTTEGLEKITYCFDTNIHDVKEEKLKEEVNSYGGGGTNIYKGFQHLDNILNE